MILSFPHWCVPHIMIPANDCHVLGIFLSPTPAGLKSRSLSHQKAEQYKQCTVENMPKSAFLYLLQDIIS